MLDTKLGRSQRHRELKLFPIIALNPAPLPYRLMAETLADRTLLITEVGSGSVPVPQHAPSKVRKHARRAEARAAVERPSPETACRVRAQDELSAAQGPVWDEIRKYGNSLGGQSSTGALDSLYLHRGEEIDHWIRRFPIRDGQIGILAYLGGETLGLDVVGDPALYERFHCPRSPPR